MGFDVAQYVVTPATPRMARLGRDSARALDVTCTTVRDVQSVRSARDQSTVRVGSPANGSRSA